jgi:hypothetical protein
MEARPMKAVTLSILFLAIAADSVRAQESMTTQAVIVAEDQTRAFRELLKNIENEAEKYGRLHPLPPPVRVPKRVEPAPTNCVDQVRSRDEWTYASESSKSEYWEDVIGTIVVCAIDSATSKSRSRSG